MTSKRILEKTQDQKDDEGGEDSHNEKRPKLTTNEQGSDEEKKSSADNQKGNDDDNEEGKDGSANEAEERVRGTVQSGRHEWLGKVERRHVRVGDAYQVTSLPTPGGHREEGTNGSNGKKKE
jgi:hypothetical protein